MSRALFKKGQVEEALGLALRIPSPGYRYSALWCLYRDSQKNRNFDMEYPGIRHRLLEGMLNEEWLSF
jgi:hypothetical protein